MEKSLYVDSRICFAVENPTKDQAKVIFDWVIANGANYYEDWDSDFDWNFFGVDKGVDTWWDEFADIYNHNILTFAEFAELTGVEVQQ